MIVLQRLVYSLQLLWIISFLVLVSAQPCVAATKPHLKMIEQQVEQAVQNHQQELEAASQSGQLPVASDSVLTPQPDQTGVAAAPNLELTQTVPQVQILKSWWGGRIVLKRVNGQLWLRLF